MAAYDWPIYRHFIGPGSHLPIVESGRVLAVVSSVDLTHWLVKDRVGEVQELVDLAART